jgi:hypothetical protein
MALDHVIGRGAVEHVDARLRRLAARPTASPCKHRAVPTLPEAPARFSTITVVPSFSCSATCASRMIASLDPPGG